MLQFCQGFILGSRETKRARSEHAKALFAACNRFAPFVMRPSCNSLNPFRNDPI